MPVRTLNDLADAALLKAVWKKRLRTGLRKMPLKDFQLGHDALEYLAFDWELDSTVTNLVEELRTCQYRTAPPEVVRAAKSVGLTRPLSYLDPRDLLVYIALISLVENQLLATMHPWVRFGRAQTNDAGSDNADQSGWFRLWLRRQGQLWAMTNSHDWLVESDIANFFASMSIDSIFDHVNNSGGVDREVAELLRYMLGQFAPLRGYQVSRFGGLPQENFDGSRVIAHTYLRSLDAEFEAEGLAGRYSRWVDDLVMGADTWADSLQIVRRVQLALENIDLFPNGSKTRIVRRSDFSAEHMKDENDYIGTVDEQFSRHGVFADPSQVRSRIQDHARLQQKPRGWERVLRRYYTLSKKSGETALLAWWHTHLALVPGSAPQILEYLTSFQLSSQRIDKLRRVQSEFGGTYEDIDLLCFEAAAGAPNTNSSAVRTAAVQWAWDSFDTNLHSNPRLASACTILIAKFGYASDIDRLEKSFTSEMAADSVCRQQATVVLLALGRISKASLPDLLHDASAVTGQHVRFLTAVLDGEARARHTAASLIQPSERWNPQRQYVRPRALLLAPVLRAGYVGNWAKLQDLWQGRMAKNPPRVRDAAARRWLTGDVSSILHP